MEHFSIIKALCRTALGGEAQIAVRQQIERLRDALRQAGDKDAVALELLLAQATRATEMAPSRLTQSRTAAIAGEDLSRNAPVPVDRETSTPIADVIFPDTPRRFPLFEEPLTSAAKTLVREWQHSSSLLALGVEPARSCLIYGPPGTGKTSLAYWLAGELGLPAVVARLDGLISSLLGTTARNVGNLFSFVNKHRCVLVLDEFDAIAKVRDDPHEVGEIKRVVNALLQNIDGRRHVGITIAVTNHEALLDPAIWRRFEIHLHVPPPGFDGRLAIAKLHLAPLPVTSPVSSLIAWLTDGLSGADVETFAKGLKKHVAITGATLDHPVDVLRQVATFTGSRIRTDRLSALALDPQQLAQRLMSDENTPFSQSDLAQLLARDKATISRWLRAA